MHEYGSNPLVSSHGGMYYYCIAAIRINIIKALCYTIILILNIIDIDVYLVHLKLRFSGSFGNCQGLKIVIGFSVVKIKFESDSIETVNLIKKGDVSTHKCRVTSKTSSTSFSLSL